MKKITILTLSIFFVTIVSAQKLTVLDYFEKLPEEHNFDYKIESIEGEWITMSNADYEIKPTVDIINGFIEIVDDGTGGGTTKLQVVLYRKKDGSALIAVSKFVGDGIGNEVEINFLELKNNKWQDVTTTVLPDIGYDNFLKNGKSFADYPEDLSYLVYLDYKLPQYGTTIEVSMGYDYFLTEQCLSDATETPENKEAACDLMNNISQKPIELKWDKQNRKFIIK